jgi:hypothetical protein
LPLTALEVLPRRFDDQGRLWMSSNKGIFHVPKAELEDVADGRKTSVHSTLYGEMDGMRSRECNGGSPAGWKTGPITVSIASGVSKGTNITVTNFYVLRDQTNRGIQITPDNTPGRTLYEKVARHIGFIQYIKDV